MKIYNHRRQNVRTVETVNVQREELKKLDAEWLSEREKKDDEQGEKEESEWEGMKDRNSEKESVSAEGEQRQRRSGSVKSYCTKYIFGAHYGKHIRFVRMP